MKNVLGTIFIVGLLTASCSSSDNSGSGGTSGGGGQGGSAVGGSGGTRSGGSGGGATGGSGGGATGGSGGGATGGSGGANAGGVGGANAGGNGGAGTGGSGGAAAFTWPATCPSSMILDNVPVADFCARYDAKCGTKYGTTDGHFKDKADCMTKYAAYASSATAADDKKGCAAYHLCVAGQSEAAATMHCLHPAAGDGNPCRL